MNRNHLMLIALLTGCEETKGAPGTAPAQQAQPSPAPTENGRHWYEGGTLHDATAADWKKATAANKLATCGDFLAKLWLSKSLSPTIQAQVNEVDDLKTYAGGLVGALDKAFEGKDPEAIGNPTVSATAVILLGSMGWVK